MPEMVSSNRWIITERYSVTSFEYNLPYPDLNATFYFNQIRLFSLFLLLRSLLRLFKL